MSDQGVWQDIPLWQPQNGRVNYLKAILLLVWMCGISACDQINQPVFLDPPPLPKQLVVNGVFTPEAFWEVSVTLPYALFENQAAPSSFSEAFVKLYGNGQLIEVLPFVVACGCYRSATNKPQFGVTYQLIVSASGYPTATATARLPDALTLDRQSMGISRSTEKGPQNTINRRLSALVALEFTDALTEGDQYMIAVMQETTTSLQTTTYPSVLVGYRFKSSSEWLSASGEFDDELSGEDDRRRIATFIDKGMAGQQIKIPITISGYTLRYREGSTSEGTKLFTDRMKYRVILARMSPELYQYERSIMDQRTFSDVPIVEPVPIYSNISNGLGIFAGYAGTTIEFQ